MRNLIITRHQGLVEWLKLHGVEGDVVAHATSANVAGRHVYGVLPLSIAAFTASITTVEIPGLTPEQRGKDLSPAEMDAAGAALRTFVVREVAK